MSPSTIWESLAPAAPWAGAAVLILIAVIAIAAIYTRWSLNPGDELESIPLALRWVPSLVLGCGCAAAVFLLMPDYQTEARVSGSALVAFLVTYLCTIAIGRVSEAAVSRRLRESTWRLNSETVCTQMRRLLRAEEFVACASKAIERDLEATLVYVYVLKADRFELLAADPPIATKASSFLRTGPLARAFAFDGRRSFLVLADPLKGTEEKWWSTLRGMLERDIDDDRQALRLMDVECAVGFWRNSQLAGFFLFGGRLKSERIDDSQRFFATEVVAEVGRMFDVLEGAESMAAERSDRARIQTENQFAGLVRRRMAPPDTFSVPGLEFGVASDPSENKRAGFCDSIVLPGAALGVVMADTAASGPQAAIDMVRLQALLRARFYVYGEDLREMLDSVERAMVTGESEIAAVNLFIGRCDARSRRFVYINAGYLPPVLLRNRNEGSETRRLSATGRPLAGLGPSDWCVQEIELRRRDLLLAISPALVSHPNAGDKWSENRLLETMLDLEKLPAQQIALRLLREAYEANGKSKPDAEHSVIVLRPADSPARSPAAS
jgi:hypothetical protein